MIEINKNKISSEKIEFNSTNGFFLNRVFVKNNCQRFLTQTIIYKILIEHLIEGSYEG